MKEEKIIENGIKYTVKTYNNGDVAWFLNGKEHRVKGPAVTWYDGWQGWYLHGKLLTVNSQQEFEQWLKLRAFT